MIPCTNGLDPDYWKIRYVKHDSDYENTNRAFWDTPFNAILAQQSSHGDVFAQRLWISDIHKQKEVQQQWQEYARINEPNPIDSADSDINSQTSRMDSIREDGEQRLNQVMSTIPPIQLR